MQRWPDRRIVDLLGIEIPIIQAPMAGADSVALAQAVSSAGGLGSLACALLTPDAVRESRSRAARRDGEVIQPELSLTLWPLPIWRQ